MSEHISVILDKVLERLDAAEPLEAVLADYPSQRDELISLLAVARELSSLQRVPPLIEPQAGLAAFMDEARVLASETTSRRSRWRWLDERLVALRSLPYSRTWATARVVTFSVLLFVLVGGMMSLSADSLPGDWLYPVKLVGEEARLSLTFSQSARAEYHLQRARNRAEEIQCLVRAGRPVDERTLARLEGALESSLLAAASADQSETPQLLFAIEQMSAEQAALLEVVQVVAVNSRTYQLLDRARASLAQVESLAQIGRANVYVFRLNARLGTFQLGAPSLLLETEPLPATLSPTPTFYSGEGGVDEARTFTPTTTPTARPSHTHTPTAEPSDTPAPSATPEPGNTPEPPTATATFTPPTATVTFTPAPPSTDTPQPPEQTNTPQPPEQTNTPQPPEQINTPQLPGQTDTPPPPGQTNTPQPPGQTNTPQPPGQTNTPQPPGQTNTPQPPGQTNTPQPPGQTNTPQPPGQTNTPQPPGQANTPKPTKTPKP